MGVAPVAEANIIPVLCEGDDSVAQGSLLVNGAPFGTQSSEGVLETLATVSDPAAQPPYTFEAQVQVTTEQDSFVPGSQEVDFFVQVVLPQEVVDQLSTFGLSQIDITNSTIVIAPGNGVTGPSITAGPSNFSIPVAGGVASPPVLGPFSGTFDVTAGAGQEVTFEMASSELAFGLSGTLNGASFAVLAGLACESTGDLPAVSGLVVNPNGPVTPSLSEVTRVNTPVATDLAAAIDDGPAAPTDLSTLAISDDPSNGTVSLANGVATYTPNSGFVGDDSYQYTVCTEEFVTVQQVNQIDLLTLTDPTGGTYTLTVNGETTGPIPAGADAVAIQAALEALPGVGDGNVAVSGAGPFSIEFTGALGGTAVTVSVDDADLNGTATIQRSQNAVAEQTGTICNNGQVRISVQENPPSTTTTSTTAAAGTATAATPVAAAAKFTG